MNRAAHPLRQWMKDQGLHARHVAGRLGVVQMSLSRWFNGHREMQVEHRIAVEALTDGAVTRSQIDDWQAVNLKRLTRKRRNSVGAAATG